MFLSYQKDENSNNIKTEQIRKIKDEVIKGTEKQNDLNYMLAKALPTTSTSTQHCIDEDTQSLFNQPPSINSFPNYIHSLPFSINRNLLQSLFFLFHRNPALLSSYSNLLQNQFNYFYTHYNNFPHFYDHLRSCLSIKPDNENHKIIDNEDKGLKLCDSRSKLGSDLLFSGDYHEEKKRKVGDIIRNKKKNNSENFKIDRILNNCFDQKQKSPAQKIFSKEDKLLLSKSPKDIPTQRNRNLFFPIGELQESIYDNGFARNTLKEHQHNYFESFLNNFATKDFPSSTNTNQYNKSYKNKFKNKAENDRKNFPLFYYEDRVPKPLVKLEGVELWRKFHEACTEMVITKNGRRMFPSPCIQIFNLEKDSLFSILMDVVPVNQFRYKFQGSAWVIAGRADPEPSQDAFTHPDSPALGSHWMNRCITFSRLKLTNHPQNKPGYVGDS